MIDKHLPPTFCRTFFKPRFWSTWLMLGFCWTIAQLPIRANLGLGKALGWLFFHLAGSRRRIAAINIRLCFPELSETAQSALVRSTIESCGISVVETAMALWGPTRRLRRAHTISGLEHIHAAQSAGKGVLLVGCHMTTLDMGGHMLALHTKADFLYRQDPNPLLAYMMVSARERFNGTGIINVETRKLVRHLREGRVVWYAPDQDHGAKHSIFAPFFGIQAATVPGTGRFARLGNAVVIPFFHYREAGGRYRIELKAPLENFPSGDDLVDATRINHEFEMAIRQQPEQYLWVHRRFKTRPVGEEIFYPKKTRKSREQKMRDLAITDAAVKTPAA